MAETNVYTFAVNKVEIASYNNGAAPTSWTNIPVIAESTAEYTRGNADVSDAEGNLLNIWYHSQRARVTLRVKLFAFRVIEIATGSPVSSAQGADKMDIGVDAELNPPNVRLRLQQKAVDYTTGTTGYFEVVIYKARGALGPLTMRETTPGEYTIEFNALKSTKDEQGNTLPGNGALFHARGLYTTSN